jgi:hypothetical protein
MSDEQTPTGTPPPSHQMNGPLNDLHAECERLRQTIKELTRERDQYQKALCVALAAQIKLEDIVIPDEKDCLPLGAFIHELEAIVNRD